MRNFLGVPLTDETPDHSSLTKIGQRLPVTVSEQVFEFVLTMAAAGRLLKGTTVGVDSTTLEANAAMRTIVRRDTGEDWKTYLKNLAAAEGLEIESDEDLRRFDQQRRKQGKKKVTNEEWTSPSGPDARIGKMKDGRTHLNYKAEHVVDLHSEIIIQADVHHGNEADPQTVIRNLVAAQVRLDHCFDSIATDDADGGMIEDVAADKGYHANEVLKHCADLEVRTYIPERKGGDRRWSRKDAELNTAFHNNRQRMQRSKEKNLQKRRSEVVERGFAHVCETGGGRRMWLRGLENVRGRHLIRVPAHHLGLVMRQLFGFSNPRAFSAGFGFAVFPYLAIVVAVTHPGRFRVCLRILKHIYSSTTNGLKTLRSPRHPPPFFQRAVRRPRF